MDWNRSKNIIILLLLIVNIFLAVNLGYSLYVQKAAREAQVASLMEYLGSKGIVMDSGILPGSNLGRVVMLVERDRVLESAAADILVETAASKTDGGVARYSGPGGNIMVQSGGVLQGNIKVNYAEDESWEQAADSFTALLSDAGISSGFTDSANGVITIQGAHNNLKIFNCEVSAESTQDGWSIGGRWCFGAALPVNNDAEMDAIGLVVKFVNRITAFGIEIRSIDGMEAGYLANNVLSIGIRLTPVYRIATDMGEFYINAIDGTLVSAEY